MRLSVALLLPAMLLSGCAANYTVSPYSHASPNPAHIELKTHDTFRNSDRLTHMFQTHLCAPPLNDLRAR